MITVESKDNEAIFSAIDPETGALYGASDRRKDGLALGY